MIDRFDKAYITWINDGQQAWTLMGAGMGADAETEIHARPVPLEPMVGIRFYPLLNAKQIFGLPCSTSLRTWDSRRTLVTLTSKNLRSPLL